MGVFDGEKYQAAAERALQFIKNQLDINHFDYSIHWGDEYSDWYEGDVMWGSVTGFSGSESEIEPRYISTSRFYGYDYTGQVSGSWRNVSSPSDAGVNVYVYRDQTYKVVACPLQSGGSWVAEWEYKEVYTVTDPETGETHEEEVYYTLPAEVGEGIKEFRLGYGLTFHWELISETEDMKAYRKEYSLSREESAENGGYAYGYLTDYSVRAFAFADTEYLLEDCKIWNCGSGGYIWFTNRVTQGHKIAKLIHPIPGGYEVIGLAGAVANLESGRLPASFFIPEDDPQYDKDGTKALHVYGYCLNSRTWAYDVGLALLVFTTSGDYDICKEMLDRMMYEQNYDGSFNFSYDIYIGQLFEDYVRTGAMGWLLWGACYYALTTGDTAYNEMIKKAGDFLISRQITDTKDPRYGLLKGGYGTYDFDDYSYIEGEIEWCSTEHQCSALQGLEGCSLVLNVKKYKEAAELIRDQIYFKLYDAEHGRFFQGISAVPDSAWALDCTTWAGLTAFSILNKECSFACEESAKDEYLTSGKYIVQSGEQDYYNQRYSSSHAFSGFKPYSDRDGGYTGSPDIVWSEGTLGYAALALMLGHGEEAQAFVDECIALQEIENGTGGVLYVTATHAQLPWEFHVWESVVSSAWLYLLIKNPDVLFPKTLRQVYYMARITNIHQDEPVPPRPTPEIDKVLFYKINLNTGEIDRNTTLTFRLATIDLNRFTFDLEERIGYGRLSAADADLRSSYGDPSDYQMVYWGYTSKQKVEAIYGNLGHYLLPDFENGWDPEEYPEWWEEDEEYWRRKKAAYETVFGAENRLQPTDAFLEEGYGWTTGAKTEKYGMEAYYAWCPYNGSLYYVVPMGDTAMKFSDGYFCSYSPTFSPDTAANGHMYCIDPTTCPDGKITADTVIYTIPSTYNGVDYGWTDYSTWETTEIDHLRFSRAFFDGGDTPEEMIFAIEAVGLGKLFATE